MKAYVAERRSAGQIGSAGQGGVAIRIRGGAPGPVDGVPGPRLEAIYRSYASDLIRHARRWGGTLEDAEDFTHDFFLRLAERDLLETFDGRKGTFRSFLLTLFQRFLVNRFHRLHAQRRGGAATRLPLEMPAEAGDDILIDRRTPETIADLHWARLLLDHALATLRQDLARKGKAHRFDIFVPHLLHTLAGASYTSLGKELGLSGAASRMAAARYRDRLRILICRELEGHGRTPDQLRDLFAIFSG